MCINAWALMESQADQLQPPMSGHYADTMNQREDYGFQSPPASFGLPDSYAKQQYNTSFGANHPIIESGGQDLTEQTQAIEQERKLTEQLQKQLTSINDQITSSLDQI